jgi:hypothetical protein
MAQATASILDSTEAADHTLTDDGRFRREADMHRGVASTASVADDPNQTSANSSAIRGLGSFCSLAQCLSLPRGEASAREIDVEFQRKMQIRKSYRNS